MIGFWSPHASSFLLALAAATTLFFAIPILLTPLRWARMMLWTVPEDTRLAVYFGRCLGAFATIFEIFVFRAGLTGVDQTFVFEFMILVWLFMLAIHIVGAVQRVQPITETLEIGFWAVLIVLTLAFWPIDG
ncbi:hypothetical protein [Methylocapsa palsarum]|uniref:Uncharacterized protein n=1 Tax=Methylocapsa palsarum TaxID=1612308 RepID=A0A1I4AXL4_9HYPH|nr:hypothetical protein [Methylocapsa palsarum]SFK61342.1 hypothetical protein SAMN05444581_11226 [Methylocapsa palsarum]